MAHKVTNVTNLYDDAVALYNTHVKGDGSSSADGILKSLAAGIQSLKDSWEGVDAGVQINSLISVYNAMIEVRNALAQLAVDSSTVAVDYREIQRANGASSSESLPTLNIEIMSKMEEYSDTSDTINITADAVNGKANIDSANENLSTFISSVSSVYEKIIENWSEGAGRDNAVSAFESFVSSVGTYQQTLTEVCNIIKTVLTNYGII